MKYYKRIRGARPIDTKNTIFHWSNVDLVYKGIPDHEWLSEDRIVSSIQDYSLDFLGRPLHTVAIRECMAVLEEHKAIMVCDFDDTLCRMERVRDIVREKVSPTVIMGSTELMEIAGYEPNSESTASPPEPRV